MSSMKAWLSPAHWVSLAINQLQFMIRRRAILTIIAIDILFYAGLLAFFATMREITELHGWPIRGWVSYATVCMVCILIGCFGFAAVLRRKVRLTQAYFGGFFVAFFLCIFLSIPIFDTKCTCDNYSNCQDVKAFARLKPGMVVMNPFIEPMGVKEKTRHVPFVEPPKEGKPVSADGPKPATLVSSLMQDGAASGQMVVGISASSLQTIGHRHGSRRAGREERRLSALVGSQTLEAASQLAATTTPRPKPTPGTTTEERKQQGHMEMQKMGDFSRKAMKFFAVVTDRIRFAYTSREGCSEKAVAPEDFNALSARLKHLNERALTDGALLATGGDQAKAANGTKAQANATDSSDDALDERILVDLWKCLVDDLCEGISVKLRSRDSILKMCPYRADIVPTLVGESGDKKGKQEISPAVFFLKRRAVVAADKSNNSQGVMELMQDFKDVDLSPGSKEDLSTPDEDRCRCKDPDSCRYYKLGDNDDYWCSIDASKKQVCMDEGVSLKMDGDGVLWSTELCARPKTTCQCSGTGSIPHSADNDVKLDKLKEAPWNYGATCDKWGGKEKNALDWEWCYVGLDSACADRTRSRSRGDGKDDELQFWSYLPCEREAQRQNLESVGDLCAILSRVIIAFMLFILVKFLPMGVALFAFLANRCGDSVEEQEQWAVPDSEEEEEAEAEAATDEDADVDKRESEVPDNDSQHEVARRH